MEAADEESGADDRDTGQGDLADHQPPPGDVCGAARGVRAAGLAQTPAGLPASTRPALRSPISCSLSRFRRNGKCTSTALWLERLPRIAQDKRWSTIMGVVEDPEQGNPAPFRGCTASGHGNYVLIRAMTPSGSASRLLIIRLLQHAPTGSVEGCHDRHSPKLCASFNPTSRRRRHASSTWRRVGGRTASSVLDAGMGEPTNW